MDVREVTGGFAAGLVAELQTRLGAAWAVELMPATAAHREAVCLTGRAGNLTGKNYAVGLHGGGPDPADPVRTERWLNELVEAARYREIATEPPGE